MIETTPTFSGNRHIFEEAGRMGRAARTMQIVSRVALAAITLSFLGLTAFVVTGGGN